MPEECGVLGRSQSKHPPPEMQNHGVRLLWEQNTLKNFLQVFMLSCTPQKPFVGLA
jgi:hypothetical protein